YETLAPSRIPPAIRKTIAVVEDATMHKIAISPAALDRMTRRMGKLHPFDTMTPRKTGLLVIDIQNYFVKPGHQGEIPMAREIAPNVNRLAAGRRPRRLDPQWHQGHAGKLVDIARVPDDTGAGGTTLGGDGHRRRRLCLLAPQRHMARRCADHQDSLQRFH